MKSHFVQLGHSRLPTTTINNQWFVSEKLDGMRCIWDGGVTRGMYSIHIPFANNDRKAAGQKLKATGLWSRYGNIIHAPDFFLDQLPPNVILDGELYTGRKDFQTLRSIVSTLPENRIDTAWRRVKYCVFDRPAAGDLFAERVINEINFKKNMKGVLDWYKQCVHDSRMYGSPISQVYPWLVNNIKSDVIVVIQQQVAESEGYVDSLMEHVLAKGGEGLIIKRQNTVWRPLRTWDVQKIKDFDDAEGKVVGYTTGLGKYRGMMGALVVETDEKRFKVSGFTDAQRQLAGSPNLDFGQQWAYDHPGEEDVPSDVYNPLFPIGTMVTYRYRELTDGGIPKEARFLRKT